MRIIMRIKKFCYDKKSLKCLKKFGLYSNKRIKTLQLKKNHLLQLKLIKNK